MHYWYSSQLRQYRLQFIRAFSNFYVETGYGGSSKARERIKVPCRYGDSTRLATMLIRGNSENKILTVPFMSCYVSSLGMNAARRQDPQFSSTVRINERKYDTELGKYTNEIGNRYAVERYMPVPYDLTMQLDIWTNNEDIKEQLLEQILVLFNPMIDVQTSTNPIDWTVLTIIEMQDSIVWTSRSIPIGTDNPIDVSTIQFKLPIWINPPAKVKKQAIIEEIIINIVEGHKDTNAIEWDEYTLLARAIITPDDAIVLVSPIDNYTYSINRCDSSGSTVDKRNLPTVVTSSQYPTLSPGLSFTWNNINCNINSSTIADAVNDIRECLVDTNLNCIIYNDTSIQFINTDGGDNTFDNIFPGTLELLGLKNTTYPGGTLAWWRLLQEYGDIKEYSVYGETASQLRLKTTDDVSQVVTDLVGWIDFDSVDQNKLIWTINSQSFPTTTISAIDAIVDPTVSGPTINLPQSVIGQRYLLTDNPSQTSASWGNIAAIANDIVEFDGKDWNISWSSKLNENSTQYVLNKKSNKIYKWANNYWKLLIDPKYHPGMWTLSI